jgi:hypothetical protein
LLQADARPLRRGEHARISSLLPDNARFASGRRSAAAISLDAARSGHRAGSARLVRGVAISRVRESFGAAAVPSSASFIERRNYRFANLILLLSQSLNLRMGASVAVRMSSLV